MKTAVYILMALLVGMVLGSLPIKGDLRGARSEIEELKKKLASRNTGSDSLTGINSILRIPAKTAPAQQRNAGRAHSRTHIATSSDTDTESVETTGSLSVATAPESTSGPSATNLNQMLETASAVWKTRTDLARDSFVANVAATPDQVATFDVVMAAMNIRLSNSIRTWVDFAQQEKDITPETGIKIMNDLSSSLVLTYNDLDRTMPGGWRTNAGPKFQVFDFINPDVAKPLTEVEGLFKGRDHHREVAWDEDDEDEESTPSDPSDPIIVERTR
jgi:hypothetical protein